MDFNKIPEVMKQEALWCIWKKGKIPCNPQNPSCNAKSNDKNTFSDFETARKTFENGEYEGLGIGIFNGFSAIDIDHCIENGKLSDLAKDIIDKMGSYTEISPSGTGIHIIFTVKDFEYNKDLYYVNNQKSGLEVYVSGATSKFVTITGNAFNNNPVVDGSLVLQKILDTYMRRNSKEIKKSENRDVTINITDCEFLKIGLEKDKKLIAYWNGERVLKDKSESENDMGFIAKLLYWTNNNVEEAIRAFKSSPYVSQKDQYHLEKLERPDYLPRVIEAAMPSRTAAENNAKYKSKHSDNKVSKPGETLKLISAQDLQGADLPPTKYLIKDILPQGTSILTAASKIGKSWLVLDMGLSIATGKNFFGKQTEQASVLYLALEDSLKRLQDRINKILNNNPAPANLHLLIDSPNLDNGLLQYLDEILKQYSDIKLIIIDTLQKIRGQALPRENAYQQDYREMGLLKQFADKHKISILLVHHNRKLVDEDDPFNMISGTNGIMGAADSIYLIRKKSRNDENATLHITGRDVLQSNMVIRFNKDTCRWENIGGEEDIERQEYESNPIVKTIQKLVKDNPVIGWKGTASNLIYESQKNNTPILKKPQEVGYEINKLTEKGLLKKYDNIEYTPCTNGNAGKIYHFSKHNFVNSIKFSLDEDEDDYSDVEF